MMRKIQIRIGSTRHSLAKDLQSLPIIGNLKVWYDIHLPQESRASLRPFREQSVPQILDEHKVAVHSKRSQDMPPVCRKVRPIEFRRMNTGTHHPCSSRMNPKGIPVMSRNIRRSSHLSSSMIQAVVPVR